MKIQNINELLDTNDIIKKSELTQAERDELLNEYQRANNLNTPGGQDHDK